MASKPEVGAALEITLETEGLSRSRTIRLRFAGVQSVNIRDFGGDSTRILGLEARNIANRQWENLSWEVEEFENSQMSLFAKTVECERFD